MAIRDFKELEGRLRLSGKKTVAVAAANDAHSLEAVFLAGDEGLLDYILVGDGEKIRETAGAMGRLLPPERVVSCGSEAEAAAQSVRLVREGRADFLQKGLMQTSSLLRAVLDREEGIGTGRLMSHIALLEIPGYHKLVGMTDGGMIPHPGLEQKKAILSNALRLFRGFGYEEPKAAVLCGAETVNPKIPETVDACELQKLAEQGAFGKCRVAGPVSLDLAMSREAAEIKGYRHPVAGDADILLAPDMAAGNLMAKGMLLFGGARMAGCVLGAGCPVALNSRGASLEEKYNALLICAGMA